MGRRTDRGVNWEGPYQQGGSRRPLPSHYDPITRRPRAWHGKGQPRFRPDRPNMFGGAAPLPSYEIASMGPMGSIDAAGGGGGDSFGGMDYEVDSGDYGPDLAMIESLFGRGSDV